jgi:hypothetical protein
MTNRPSRITTGIAGEHFVAGELAKRGWIATLTAKNTPAVDVLAQRPASATFAAIQVKTRTPAYRYAWRVGNPGPAGERDYYVFVDVGSIDEQPRYWIVPASTAVALITNEQIRVKDIQEFEGRWELLERSA